MTEQLNQYKQLVKDAIVEIKRKNKEIEQLKSLQPEAIAIVGMACRFPGPCNTPNQFWNLLVNNQDALIDMTNERWDMSAFYDPDVSHLGKIHSKKIGLIDQVDQFDAEFFGISPREMASLDPQHRLLLELSWEAVESSGHAMELLTGTNTGVFVGIMSTDYSSLYREHDQSRLSAYVGTGNAHSAAAGRVSYTFGFNGPCMAVDTACSSSLVSVHLACQSLRSHESDAALAGGVNLILSPDTSIIAANASMLSQRGKCSSFDAHADGYVRAEGCGMLMLKRLSDAEKAGDTIYAVIKGSAVNQDGKSAGLTVPNEQAQVALITSALKQAGIQSECVDYIETHGSGTPLGDPIEIAALAAVFKDRKNPLFIGSVKTNVGHMESSAGIAGLIKVILSLQNQCLPKHLHFDTPNPHIPWNDIAIQVVKQNREWVNATKPRVAGISSFGFSGTNAHIILEEGPKQTDRSLLEGYYLLKLSAQSPDALRVLMNNYLTLLNSELVELSDLCYTAAVGRNDFRYRCLLGGISKAALIEQLHGVDINNIKASTTSAKAVFRMKSLHEEILSSSIAFYQTYPSVKETMAAQQHLGQLGAFQFALAKFWLLLGVEPAYIVAEEQGTVAALALNQPTDSFRIIGTLGELEPGDILIDLGDSSSFYPILKQLYAAGFRLNWAQIYFLPQEYRRIQIPGYPFQRRRYWLTDDLLPTSSIDWAGSDSQQIIFDYVRFLLAKTLKLKKDEINFYESFIYYGLDSLMGMEIKRQIEIDLNVSLSLSAFLNNMSLHEFVELLAQQLVDNEQLLTNAPVLLERLSRQELNDKQDEMIEIII